MEPNIEKKLINPKKSPNPKTDLKNPKSKSTKKQSTKKQFSSLTSIIYMY